MARRSDLDIDLELYEARAEQRRRDSGQKASGPRFTRQSFSFGAVLRKIISVPGLLLLPVVVVAAYYLIGMALIYQINDDLTFRPKQPINGGSAVADMGAALIDRAVNDTAWPANDPWFAPGYFLDNMANFQRGTLYAVRIMTDQLRQAIGRERGSSIEDTSLNNAWSRLSISPNRWLYNFGDGGFNLIPQRSTEAEYREAIDLLRDYSRRVANGEALKQARPDNLIEVLRQVRNDLGAMSAASQEYIEDRRTDPVLDGRHDRPATDYELYYRAKGICYGYYLLLTALEADFGAIIEQRDVGTLWRSMLDNLATVGAMQHFMTISGAPDGQFLPNHLANQGFYILRARIQVAEIMDILSK